MARLEAGLRVGGDFVAGEAGRTQQLLGAKHHDRLFVFVGDVHLAGRDALGQRRAVFYGKRVDAQVRRRQAERRAQTFLPAGLRLAGQSAHEVEAEIIRPLAHGGHGLARVGRAVSTPNGRQLGIDEALHADRKACHAGREQVAHHRRGQRLGVALDGELLDHVHMQGKRKHGHKRGKARRPQVRRRATADVDGLHLTEQAGPRRTAQLQAQRLDVRLHGRAVVAGIRREIAVRATLHAKRYMHVQGSNRHFRPSPSSNIVKLATHACAHAAPSSLFRPTFAESMCTGRR